MRNIVRRRCQARGAPEPPGPASRMWQARILEKQETRQDARPVDDAALSEAVGFHRAKTLDTRGAARSAKIAAWLRSDYESIAARAKREKAVMHWSGETGVRDRDLTGWESSMRAP